MKQGKTFEEVVARVEREAHARHDYYASANELRLVSAGGGSRLQSPIGEFEVRDTAHTHIAELAGIDRRYYSRLRDEAPELLDQNVNHWLERADEKPRLLRTLADEDRADVRAIVSPRYATLDNDALLRVIDPVIAGLNATIESCDIADERLVIKLVSPRLQGDVRVNDPVQAGLLISNSEVRAGAVSVDIFISRLVCTNGMVLTGSGGNGARRRHVGRNWNPNDHRGLIPEDADRKEWENGVWGGILSDIQQAVSQDSFGGLLERLKAATRLQTRLEPDQLVQRFSDAYKIGEEAQVQILNHLVADNYSGTLWDVANAMTRTAADQSSYAAATELETLGGVVARLSPRQWEKLINLN